MDEFEDELVPYEVSKGTIKFPLDKALPVALIRKIALFRARENADRAPAKKRSMPPSLRRSRKHHKRSREQPYLLEHFFSFLSSYVRSRICAGKVMSIADDLWQPPNDDASGDDSSIVDHLVLDLEASDWHGTAQ